MNFDQRWKNLKLETKIAFMAFLLSLVTLSYTEIKNYIYSEAERQRSDIKLNIISLLSSEKRLRGENILDKYNNKFSTSLEQENMNQALYEALKDGVVVFTHDSKTYEVSSFHSIHKEVKESYSKIKLNVIDALSSEKKMTKEELVNIYHKRYNIKTGEDRVLESLYETLKDGVVVFTNDTKTYELKSYISIH
jgi:hypothetical protein